MSTAPFEFTPSSSAFRRIVTASQVEEAVMTTLKTWFGTYLRELQRWEHFEPGTLPIPENYSFRREFDSEKGERLPKVVVTCPGLHTTPETSGGGQYRAMWRVGVGVAMSSKSEEIANRVVKAYGAAVRAILLQKRGLDHTVPVANIVWLDEGYGELIVPDQFQQYRAVEVIFGVDVNDVVTKGGGPSAPDLDDPDNPDVYNPGDPTEPPVYTFGKVQLVDIDVEKEAPK